MIFNLKTFLSFTFTLIFVFQMNLLFSQEIQDDLSPASESHENQIWLNDYDEAVEIAKNQKKMLLVFFKNMENDTCRTFWSESLNQKEIQELLNDYVLVEASMISDQKSKIQQVSAVKAIDGLPVIVPPEKLLSGISKDLGKNATLISRPEFSEMLGKPGLAVVDFKNDDEDLHGKVVSVFPFLNNKPYNVFETKTILTLPPGTVTQRSMIYAVRVHPEKPKSTNGELNDYLTDEAESHSQHQARIRLQGHHNWDSRFQKITARLANHEIWASEVCAESWPGQGLLESAIECVRCWRLSSGHWSAVVAEHPYYGYDMKRGTNGVWYATGIFGKWKNARRTH